ncbi:MAG: hypothetical protein R3E89_09245 [Thiolinea sp.]
MNTVDMNPSIPNQNPDAAGKMSVLTTAVTAGINRDAATPDKSLEMVRNILFGEQVREIERKHTTLDRLARASVNALAEDTQKKIEGLHQEIAQLKEMLATETRARQDNNAGIHARLEQHERKMEEQAAFAQAGRDDLHTRIGREVERLDQRTGDWRSELLEQIRTTAEQLRHEKADRKVVAGILNGMARQLFDGESGASGY